MARPTVSATRESVCPYCRQPIEIGQRIRPSRRGWRHPTAAYGRCVLGWPVTVTHVKPSPNLSWADRTCVSCNRLMPAGTNVQRTLLGWRHGGGCP